ncbi:major facilitator superfamily domain-containing protein [Xylariaceae sp. FL0594]|nr:major facilitator superfamily domain-containing protein [Xylariaceae sp. FL0594]
MTDPEKTPVTPTSGSFTDEAQPDATVITVDPERERRVLRKLDLYLAPAMTVIFLAAYLDRSNIGNAASAGMLEDLRMSRAQLGNAVTLFYVTYVAFELPCSLLMKKLKPSRMIAGLVFAWSVVIIGTGFIHTPGQLYASRLLLGAFESAMFPCLSLYLSSFYQPREQALRVSYLLVSAALSGSFGGLFAYALLKLDGAAGLKGWRWLFIVEGVASVLVAVFVLLCLPDGYESCRFLNAGDKELMRTRREIAARYHGNEHFEWKEVRKALADKKLYVSAWSQFWADICSFGLSTFLPLIIKGFGYDAVTTQLLTVPVFFWAAGAFIAVSWASDRVNRRYFFLVPACLLTAVGYAVQIGVPAGQRGALYFSTFLIAPGIYIFVGLNAAWLLNSHAGYYKRATAIGFNQSIGNSAGLVVGQIFKYTVNGKYLLGVSFSLGAVLLAGLGHTTLYFHLKSQNAKRESMTEEQRQDEIEHGKGGDHHPDYRYML